MAIIDKRRVSDTEVKQGEVVGPGGRPRRGDLRGRDITGGTLVSTIETLKRAGARTVHAGAVHGCCAGLAVEQLRAAEIESIVVTNTVSVPAEKHFDKLTVLTIAPLLAAAIERIHSGASVGALFE